MLQNQPVTPMKRSNSAILLRQLDCPKCAWKAASFLAWKSVCPCPRTEEKEEKQKKHPATWQKAPRTSWKSQQGKKKKERRTLRKVLYGRDPLQRWHEDFVLHNSTQNPTRSLPSTQRKRQGLSTSSPHDTQTPT